MSKFVKIWWKLHKFPGLSDVPFLNFLKNYFHRSIKYWIGHEILFELNFCVGLITLIYSCLIVVYDSIPYLVFLYIKVIKMRSPFERHFKKSNYLGPVFDFLDVSFPWDFPSNALYHYHTVKQVVWTKFPMSHWKRNCICLGHATFLLVFSTRPSIMLFIIITLQWNRLCEPNSPCPTGNATVYVLVTQPFYFHYALCSF